MAEEKVENKNLKVAQDVAEKPVFTWTAPEFAAYSKSSSWFLLVVVAAIVLIGIFVWQKNWTAVAVVAAAALALIIQAKTKPKMQKCSIYRSGVVIDEKVYPFSGLKSFWIVYGEHPYIRIAQAKRLSSNVNLPIAEEDPEQVRLFLAKFLPEEEQNGEDFSDTIQRWLRF